MAVLEAAADWRLGAGPRTAGRTFAGADLEMRSSACAATSTVAQHARTATGTARNCVDASASSGAGGAPARQPRARQPGAKAGAACRELAQGLAAVGLVPRSGWYRVGPSGVPPPALAEAARLALLPPDAAQRFLQRARRCAWKVLWLGLGA